MFTPVIKQFSLQTTMSHYSDQTVIPFSRYSHSYFMFQSLSSYPSRSLSYPCSPLTSLFSFLLAIVLAFPESCVLCGKSNFHLHQHGWTNTNHPSLVFILSLSNNALTKAVRANTCFQTVHPLLPYERIIKFISFTHTYSCSVFFTLVHLIYIWYKFLTLTKYIKEIYKTF